MKTHISIKDFMTKLKVTINNLTIKTFHFNFIQVNTYILYDEMKEAIIIDPGNCDENENEMLIDYIEKEKLTIKYILNTHPHIDHVLGNDFCKRVYHAPLLAHEEGMPIYKNSFAYGASFGFSQTEFPVPDIFLKEGDEILFGKQSLKVLYTPGHSNGSISLLDHNNKLVFTGDTLFEGSVGRTDLPTGDLSSLMRSIKEKLLVLEDNTLVFPGHGDSTTIGQEKNENPYL
jgi:glyoxylase-like metal-dependent hydrolase (beta-lactamase superfamily II)